MANTSDKMKIVRVKYDYVQDTDSCQSDDNNCQELTIEITDAGGDPYAILSTSRWALDDTKELVKEINRLLKIVKPI